MDEYLVCPKCGQKNLKENQVCQFCSTSFSAVQEKPTIASASPPDHLIIRPTFIPLVCLAKNLPVHLFVIFWGTGFCGGIGLLIFRAIGLPMGLGLLGPFLFFVVVAPLLDLHNRKKTYERTAYRFTATRLDYLFEGSEEKMIDLQDIMEVSLRKGTMQRRSNLGTIILSPAATEGVSRARSEIMLRDISNPDQIYQQVKEFVARAKNASSVA